MGDTSTPANVFGIELHQLVEKEESAVPVPLLIQKTVAEIERRGLKVVTWTLQSMLLSSLLHELMVSVHVRWWVCTDCVVLLR